MKWIFGSNLLFILCLSILSACNRQATVTPDVQSCVTAMMHDDVGTVKAMLAAGLSPNAKTNDGESLLNWAASSSKQNRAVIVKTLLEAGANPNQGGLNQSTPLTKFAATDCDQCVKALLEHSADVRERDESGATALWYAANRRFGQNDDAKGQSSELEMANVKIAEMLIHAGADPNAHLPGNISVLAAASAVGNEQLVRLLIKAGARPGDPDKNGTTPLLIASSNGNTNIVNQLVNAGADMNVKDQRGLSALDEARFMGNMQSAAILKNRGASGLSRCGVPTSQSSLEVSLKCYLCSDSVQMVYRGNLGQNGMDFVVAGVPKQCPAIKNEDSGSSEQGQLLERLIILRKTPDGWNREFSEDYFAKNSKDLISSLIDNAPATRRLMPTKATIQKQYERNVSFTYVESCSASGLPVRLGWSVSDQLIKQLDENGQFEADLRKAN